MLNFVLIGAAASLAKPIVFSARERGFEMPPLRYHDRVTTTDRRRVASVEERGDELGD